ncbi:hypothetical protein GYA37_04125 [candidate division WWE3 bacterium]|uniref:DUF4430 domain-containing protein n=1 Tax=candidate division WWE3 bacterium TaxID=2053526 RepID=A0A7X9E805_UNCKA|nr:hypothetical protein [candidate division WWE3 bacterium]
MIKLRAMKKKTKIFIVVYIVLLILGSLYVKSVLKESPVEEKEAEEEVEETHLVNISLKVINGTATNMYNAKLKNVDTVKDLLEEIRDHSDFSYEITEYFHKIEIDTVNKVKTPTGYKWIVMSNNNDITNDIGNTYLENNAVYELKLIKQ